MQDNIAPYIAWSSPTDVHSLTNRMYNYSLANQFVSALLRCKYFLPGGNSSTRKYQISANLRYLLMTRPSFERT